MKKNILFIAVLISIVALLYVFSTEEMIPIPPDEEHEGINEEACLDCHGAEKESPLKKDHPPKYKCLKCHKRLGH
jgi:hypothetical protein